MATRSSRAVPKPLPQTSAVADLVNSVKQHKNFKQLASYSVQCLAKAIQPPSVGWETRMKEAYDAGALTAISEVRALVLLLSQRPLFPYSVHVYACHV